MLKKKNLEMINISHDVWCYFNLSKKKPYQLVFYEEFIGVELKVKDVQK